MRVYAGAMIARDEVVAKQVGSATVDVSVMFVLRILDQLICACALIGVIDRFVLIITLIRSTSSHVRRPFPSSVV